MTGATGFVGRAVLAELLERGVEVTCLVRASSDEEGVARLQHALLLARRWRPAWLERLRVARGSLGPDGLGMAGEAWYDACQRGDNQCTLLATSLTLHATTPTRHVPLGPA